MRTSFLLGFGLLPLWAALVFIAFAFMTTSSEYAGMTILLLAPAIPSCAVTLTIAAFSSAIYSHVSGKRSRKLLISGGFLSGVLLLLAITGGMFWMSKKRSEQELLAERARAEAFARINEVVRSEAGEPLTASVDSYSHDNSGPMPTVYDVEVVGAKTVYAIIDVNRTTKPATFHLRCTTPRKDSQRDAFNPCAQ